MTLKRPLILLTNDDGINSDGVKKINTCASLLSDNIYLAAPESNCSGFGHSITLSRPLRINKLSKNIYSCDGTPTDSILLFIQEVLKGKKPDVILSGINLGSNLGDDLTYSGTVCAAFEGALLGVKSIAVSLEKKQNSKKINWSGIDRYLKNILKVILSKNIGKDNFININFPDCDSSKIKGIKVVDQSRRKPGGKFLKRKDSKGNYYFWHTSIRSGSSFKGTDAWAIKNKYISITCCNINLSSNNYSELSEKEFNEQFR